MPTNRRHSKCQHLVYRMSCEDFDELWDYADGRCQICGVTAEQTPGALVIDHDGRYERLAVRGLLCGKCNWLMRKADRGLFVPEAIPYRQHAWFVRVLDQRRETHVKGRAK